ncbi:hypothetical protein Ancab_032892 [Ancistrocladus abbreviatus]
MVKVVENSMSVRSLSLDGLAVPHDGPSEEKMHGYDIVYGGGFDCLGMLLLKMLMSLESVRGALTLSIKKIVNMGYEIWVVFQFLKREKKRKKNIYSWLVGLGKMV